jgi:hypothetical protein
MNKLQKILLTTLNIIHLFLIILPFIIWFFIPFISTKYIKIIIIIYTLIISQWLIFNKCLLMNINVYLGDDFSNCKNKKNCFKEKYTPTLLNVVYKFFNIDSDEKFETVRYSFVTTFILILILYIKLIRKDKLFF